jgi:hypothetical protein
MNYEPMNQLANDSFNQLKPNQLIQNFILTGQ